VTIDKCLAANDPTNSSNFSNVGSMTVGANAHSATFVSVSGTIVSFAKGDFIRILGPAVADGSAANFFATLAADR
jgi:hypothetical protein